VTAHAGAADRAESERGATGRPPATLPRGSSTRLSSVRDTVGKALLILFLVKPSIDLLWRFYTFIGGINFSPTTVAGLLICLLFGGLWLSRPQYSPPFARLMEAFLLLNLVSFIIGTFSSDPASFAEGLNVGIRVSASYFIYSTAFAAALRYRYQDISPFIKAIMLGSAIAVLLNVAAIQLGFGGGKFFEIGGDPSRERGLYYDAGVLSNVAVYSLIFSAFMVHVARGNLLWTLFCVLIVIFDVYLIASTKSRAGILQVILFGLVYAWMFHRSWGRILAPIGAVLVLGASMLIFDIDIDETLSRFEGDVAALEQDSGTVGVKSGGEVSLGKFEQLGNRRGALWADALSIIAAKPIHEIVLGNFSGSRAHSDYIDILGRNGIVGIVLYLAIMLGLLSRTFRLARLPHRDLPSRLTYFTAFALLLCYMLYAVPFRPLLYTTTSWYMWALLGFALARERISRSARREAAETTEDESENDKESEPEEEPPPLRPAPRSRPGAIR